MGDSVFAYTPEDSRRTTFPIPASRRMLWSLYEKARDSFWTPAEIRLADDQYQFEHDLTDGERHLVKYILAFFIASDDIVNENIAEHLAGCVPMLEARYFYNMQSAIEDIHATTYSQLLDTIVVDLDERARLFNAIETISSIKLMSEWMLNCIKADVPLAKRILLFVCVEGIFFQGQFADINILRQRGLLPGLGQANELIRRDEGLHQLFGQAIYNMILPEYQLSVSDAQAVISEAVDIAMIFHREASPNGIIGMNINMKQTYLQYVADEICTYIHIPTIYNAQDPFRMEDLNMEVKASFFEISVTGYRKADQSSHGATDVVLDF